MGFRFTVLRPTHLLPFLCPHSGLPLSKSSLHLTVLKAPGRDLVRGTLWSRWSPPSVSFHLTPGHTSHFHLGAILSPLCDRQGHRNIPFKPALTKAANIRDHSWLSSLCIYIHSFISTWKCWTVKLKGPRRSLREAAGSRVALREEEAACTLS